MGPFGTGGAIVNPHPVRRRTASVRWYQTNPAQLPSAVIEAGPLVTITAESASGDPAANARRYAIVGPK
ncbi:hypothetical protein [Rhodococcus sp. APC 3903]|uniref:hypothetical protein n=1 Tax=Rhodococcus sp. APC 3903 TaxID=3035193 RepID=UPI0025B51DA0|nr:hypothetical protein [Rhodococcus sp. APC 3903]MDN3460680.1 hypothetical protein [Rhodococcus sp. APC 3903]